jgi:hypothetical protein
MASTSRRGAAAAAAAAKLAPLQIAAPEYTKDLGRDLPTDNTIPRNTGAAALEESLTVGDNYLSSNLNGTDLVIALPHEPINTCYRNAALAALCNLQPFVNFVWEYIAANPDPPGTALGNQSTFAILLYMITEFRNWADRTDDSGPNSQRWHLRQATLAFWKRKKAAWDKFCATGAVRVKRGAKMGEARENSMHDSCEFLAWLLDSFTTDELSNLQADMNDT